jgi:hypothetical protein
VADDAPTRRRGRPALKAGEPSVPFHLRLSASDYGKACALAERHRTSVPNILRAALRVVTKQQQRLDEP